MGGAGTRALVPTCVVAVVAACAPATAGPDAVGPARTGRPGTCSHFALSLPLDGGGRPTPVEAAEWFAVYGGIGPRLPRSGWHVDAREGLGTTARSGDAALHVLQAADGTWLVDAGTRC